MINGTPVLVAAFAVLAGLTAARADDAAAPAAPAPAAPAPSRHVYLIGTLRITQLYLDLAHGTDGPVASHIVIENRGEASDRLIGATAAAGASVALLTAAEQPADAVALPPNTTLELTTGAAHLAMTGLGAVTADSPPVAATLHFERAGFLPVGFETDRAKVAVEKAVTVTPDKPVDLAQ